MLERHISHYQLVSQIGEGAMGEVYQAKDTILGKHVAIKLIHPSHRDLEAASKRFINEARAISSIDHRNVVRLHHVLRQGTDYAMVMEYIEGKSLRDTLVSGTPSVEETLRVACEAASGLVQAHAHGIIHRDLKPDNIMIAGDGVTKVLDFGVAHLVDYTSITSDGMFVGTLPYAAPEQLDHTLAIDERTDVYGLGVVVFEMLAGRRPFDPDDQRALIYQKLELDPPSISEFVTDLPEGLDRIVDRALCRNPSERYHNMSEMLHDLEIVRKRVDATTGVDEDEMFAKRRMSKRAKRGIRVAALAIAVAAAVWIIAEVMPPGKTPRIMVARWENSLGQPDLDWLSGAIMSGLIRTLGELKGHNVISRQTVAATEDALRMASMGSMPISYGAAQEVGASYLVSGTLERAGPWIRIDCELTDMTKEGVLIDSWSVEIADSTRIGEAIVELAVNIAVALDTNWRQDPRDAATTLQTASTAALRYYSLALDAVEQDNTAVAMENLFDAVAADSTFAEAHFLISWLTRDRDVEAKHYTLAMKYRLRTPPITRKLIEAQGMVWEGEIDPAIVLFEEILAENPEQVAARRELAELYAQKRWFNKAVAEYAVLHRISPLDFSFYRGWALVYLETGKRGKAIELIADWRARFPDQEAPLLEYLFLCHRIAYYTEGVALCDSVAAIDPVSQPYVCGWLLEGVGRLREAEQLFRRLVESPAPAIAQSRGYAYLAWLALRQQAYDAGLEHINAALEHQDEVFYRSLAGRLAAGTGDTELALKHAAAMVRLKPEVADTTAVPAWGDQRWYFHLLGMIELMEGDPEQAVNWLEIVMRYTSRLDRPVFRAFLGRAYMESGDYEEAARQLEETLAESPGLPEAMLYLGKTYVLQKDYERSKQVLGQLKEVWIKADEDDPLNVELYRLMAITAAND